jgi:hypothetical protein
MIQLQQTLQRSLFQPNVLRQHCQVLLGKTLTDSSIFIHCPVEESCSGPVKPRAASDCGIFSAGNRYGARLPVQSPAQQHHTNSAMVEITHKLSCSLNIPKVWINYLKFGIPLYSGIQKFVTCLPSPCSGPAARIQSLYQTAIGPRSLFVRSQTTAKIAIPSREGVCLGYGTQESSILMEQRGVVRFLILKVLSAKEIAVELKGSMVMKLSLSAAKKWHRCVANGRVTLEDDPRSGRPAQSNLSESVRPIIEEVHLFRASACAASSR